MGTIPFPTQPNQQLVLAQNALNQRDWAKAANYFEQAYQVDQSLRTHCLWLSALVANADFEAALLTLRLRETDYLTSEDLAGLYVALLLKNKLLLEARQTWQQVNQQRQTTAYWTYIASTITAAETTYLATHQAAIQKINQQLFNLTGRTFDQQITLLDQAHYLPATQYVQATAPLLVNIYAHPMVKSTILENLVRLQWSENVTLSWFEQTRQVIPAQLTLPLEQGSYRVLQAAIKQRFENTAPDLLAGLTDLSQLYVLCVYPFAAEVFEQPDEWISAIAAQMYGRDTPQISEQTRNWFLKLQDQLLPLLMRQD